jgi:hypothetical protein
MFTGKWSVLMGPSPTFRNEADMKVQDRSNRERGSRSHKSTRRENKYKFTVLYMKIEVKILWKKEGKIGEQHRDP